MSITFKKIRIKQMRSNSVDEKQIKKSSSTVHNVNTLLLLTIGFVGVLYLVQVNSLSTKGYTIKELEKKISETQKEQEVLQMRIVEAQSLGQLQQKIDTLGLIKSERVDYIKPAQIVAVR